MSKSPNQSRQKSVSDSASELRDTARILLDNSNNGSATNIALHAIMITDGYDNDPVFKLYASNNKRCQRIYSQLHCAGEDYLDSDMMEECRRAVLAVRQVFSVKNFNKSFPSVIGENLREHHLTALLFSSKFFRDHFPLKTIDHRQIALCHQKLDEGLREVLDQKNIPLWIKGSLKQSIEELRFVLNNIALFGQDEVSDLLVSITAEVDGLLRLKKAGKIATFSIGVLCAALVGVADVVSAPKNIAEGTAWLGSLSTNALEITVPLLAPPPLRLVAPKQVDPNAPADA